MKLKLQLLRDGEVIFEMPLSATEWPKNQLERELEDFGEDFQMFSRIFDALSHETRLKMMKRLMEESDQTVSFADFMRDLELNPKLVWENTKKLSDGGLLEKTEKGKYRCSAFGQVGFLMVSLALKRLMEALETLEDF